MIDKREFIKLDVGYFDNPKVGEALDISHAAVVLHIASMAYARQHRTDGLVPAKRIMRKVGATDDDAQVLLDAGLWHQRDRGRIEVHDYAKHQETREEIEAKSKKQRANARKRWDASGNASGTARGIATGTPASNASGNAEERRGEEKPATQAGAADGSDDGPQNAMAILASLGLITSEIRRDYLAHLKARGIERPTRFIVTMHGRGELRGEIEDWQAESDADNVVALKPKPVQHNTADDEHLKTCTRCRRMVGLDDVEDVSRP